MPRRPRVDLPRCWQLVSVTVRARDGPHRVEQAYRLLLSPMNGQLSGQLSGKHARHPRVSVAAIGTKEQADAGSHLRPSLH